MEQWTCQPSLILVLGSRSFPRRRHQVLQCGKLCHIVSPSYYPKAENHRINPERHEPESEVELLTIDRDPPVRTPGGVQESSDEPSEDFSTPAPPTSPTWGDIVPIMRLERNDSGRSCVPRSVYQSCGRSVSPGAADEGEEERDSSEASGDPGFSILCGTTIYIPIRPEAILLQKHGKEKPENLLTILVRRRLPKLQAGDPLPICSRELPISGQFLIEQNEDKGLVLAYNPEEQAERAIMSVEIGSPDDISHIEPNTFSFQQAKHTDPQDVPEEARNLMSRQEKEKSYKDLTKSTQEEEIEPFDPCILETLSHLPGRVHAEIAEALSHLGLTMQSLDELKPSDVSALHEF